MGTTARRRCRWRRSCSFRYVLSVIDLRATREHVGLARRQQAGPGRREPEDEVVRPVQFPRIKVELERQLRLVYHIREGAEGDTFMAVMKAPRPCEEMRGMDLP